MVSLTITFYHEGIFVGPPLEYLEGNKDTMKDLDFGNFTYGKFFECIKAATLFPPVGIFYCLPGSDLSDGIRELKNEQQLADFVATALGNGGHIDVYVEHHGYDIHDWFAKDNDDLEDYDEDECVLDDISSFVEEPQFIGEEEVIIPNRCTSNPFLNRLCKTDPKITTRNTFGTNEGNANALVEDEQEDQSVDPNYKVKPGIVYPDHDPDQPLQDMVPILGMKFKYHEEMKMMNVKEGMCASKVGRKGIQENVSKASKGKEKVAEGKGKEKVAEGKGKEKVAEGKGKEKVAEGSKVAVGNKKWTKKAIKLSKSPSKKGTKRKTSNNFCKFRLWGSWLQNEASFQIKTLILDHNCARVFDFGALVTYKWIARHYVREIVSNSKISHRELQAAIREKFLINVSLGQVRRAKQRALYDFEGGLIEHYGKLWDYRDQLLKTNPRSTVKLDIDEVSGGRTYFRRFYVCFKAMKDGWTEGCKKVIGLDGGFLKWTIKGELLTAMGRDTNNQMFLIAWAIVTVENKDNWLWFLVSLGDDLNLNTGATVTIISYGHKGLKEAVREWLPLAEHRQCVRHIYANLKKSWPGLHFKSLFLKEAHDEEACLEEQILSLMHHFADRFTNCRPEINRLVTLDDHLLIEYGRYALECMTGADMKKPTYLKSIRDELLRSMEEKR
ncbi:calcium/proton exchanger [Tanacetum coccineum]